MKLLVIDTGYEYRLGVKTDKGVVDVAAASAVFPEEGGKAPQTVHDAIAGGETALRALRSLAEQAIGEPAADFVLPEDDIRFGPCVTNPQKIVCIGLNYRKHAEETKAPIPKYPILFSKFNNALTGHGRDVTLPKTSAEVDYEAELAIVIGKRAKDVSEEEALDYVFGYCCANDLSARDLQLRTPQWLLGKTCDGFCPLGPYLVTADEVGDPNRLYIRTTVNGQVRQHSNTADMIFSCRQIVSYISRHMTLLPGDVILTGTPEGVVLGYPKEKRVYLQPGDVVSVEIERLGVLTNRLVADRG